MKPGDIVPLSFQDGLLMLSFVIALLGSYVALSAAARIRDSVREGESWRGYAVIGAVSMGGIGIWGMHFIGMQAQNLPFDVEYALIPTLFSALVAIAFSGVAFWYVGRRPFSLLRCSVAGLLAGLAVAAMHYIGVSAMRMPAFFQWNVGLVVLSVVIAVLAATAAVWLAFNVHREWQRILAAGLMAIAVCGMHYTGVAAAMVVCTSAVDGEGGLRVGGLSLPYAAFIGAILVLIAMRWQLYRSYQKYQRRLANRMDVLLNDGRAPVR
ncbi:signaling protein [Bordetella ansorpii]|uniref:Signaling protein n=1 Tax=Bordetella ansorpii TaxID=288768 RepID=A0A157NDQ9_9BORD|nr:MHYT domain-containing protein [Bordetella ansorpii]SAI19487.1 signaling protein [Bordetella ansorpii]